MASEGLVPDLVLVSPARRALETWEIAKGALPNAPAQTEPEIYEAAPEQLLAVIRAVDDSVSTLLVVGHNPGLDEFMRMLTTAASCGHIAKYPTAGVAIIDLPGATWGGVLPKTGHLARFVIPREL